VGTFADELSTGLDALSHANLARASFLERFRNEIDFAHRLAEARAGQRADWEPLILQAMSHVYSAVATPGPLDLEAAVTQAEGILEPMGSVAKQYTLHCVAHAQVDMHATGGWPHAVAAGHDTFSAVESLMGMDPEFRFSQGQGAAYYLTEEHGPELFERLRARVAEGRWEVTASTWAGCDFRYVMGESLSRHLLYTRRYIRERFGLTPEDVPITWQPHRSGHPHTLPGILVRGGVRRYCLCRGGGPPLFWWQGPDGSRVLVFNAALLGCRGSIAPEMTRPIFEFERQTGLKDYLFVYPVDTPGCEPARRGLTAAAAMNRWPIWPHVRLSTTDAFFAIAERHARPDLPVVDDELDFVWERGGTSPSRIGRANRLCEHTVVEAETIAVIARGTAGMVYPTLPVRKAWRHTMFNQAQGPLAGPGFRTSEEYSQGLFQEVLATTEMIRTRGLRQVAARVNTESVAGTGESAASPAAVVGHGSVPYPPRGGTDRARVFLVFNPLPWSRTDVVTVTLWDMLLADDRITVTDDARRQIAAQVVGRGDQGSRRFVTLAFPVVDVPATGYRTLCIGPTIGPLPNAAAVTVEDSGRMENEFFDIRLEPASGAFVRLIDKRTGRDWVPSGKRMALLGVDDETAPATTSGALGQIIRSCRLTDGATLSVLHRGPHIGAMISRRRWGDSQIDLTVRLCAGVPRVDLQLDVTWLERGSPEGGVPVLRMVYPLAMDDARPSHEVPFGYTVRTCDDREVAALRWADVSSARTGHGFTLVNDQPHSHRFAADEVALTLLRGTYDPDALSEPGLHDMRFALVPHGEVWGPEDATRVGAAFNQPLRVMATEIHPGTLPPSRSFVELLTPGVMLSAIKKAEDSDALIVRLYNLTGQAVTGKVRLDPMIVPGLTTAIEADLLERPMSSNTATVEGDVLAVNVPAHGIASVRVGT
jgi:alpha-mannosidase